MYANKSYLIDVDVDPKTLLTPPNSKSWKIHCPSPSWRYTNKDGVKMRNFEKKNLFRGTRVIGGRQSALF